MTSDDELTLRDVGRLAVGFARRMMFPRLLLVLLVWPTGQAQTTVTPTRSLAHPAEVLAVSWSPDGRSLATGCADGKVRLWNIETGQPGPTLARHTGAVNAVAYLPTGRYILSGSSDGTLVYWTVAGDYYASVDFDIGIYSLAFSNNGSRLLVGTGTWWLVLPPRPQVYVFNTTGGAPILSIGVTSSEGFYTSLAYSATGPRILTTLAGMVWAESTLWNATTGAKLPTFESLTASAVAFTSDGNYAVTGSDSEAHLWSAADGHLVRTFSHGTARVETLNCSRTGTILVTGASDRLGRVWDVGDNKCLKRLQGHTGTWNCVAVSPDGNYAASGSDDKTAKVWQLQPPCRYTDAYPYRNASPCSPETPGSDCPGDTVDDWLFFKRECTSYVAWRLNHELGFDSVPYPFGNYLRPGVLGALGKWSDAANWNDRAQSLGFPVNSTPSVGAVAHWDSGELGLSGHVAYVEAVRSDGSVDLTEYNIKSDLNQHQPHCFNYRCKLRPVIDVPRFIHLLDGLRATGQPDLVVENVTFAPPTVVAGADLTVAFDVRNAGIGVAPATRARLRLSADGLLSKTDWPLSPLDVDIPAIQPAQSHHFSGHVSVPAGTPQGKYYLGVFADCEDRAGQSDVRNDDALSATQLALAASGATPPTIVSGPQGATVLAGTDCELHVQATGTPPLLFRWFRNGALCVGAEADSLSLKAIAISQAGTYVVDVSNAGGSVGSRPADVVVLPRAEEPPAPPPAGRGVLTKIAAFDATKPSVVITHGWQVFDDYQGSPPTWATEMAQAVRNRLAAEGVQANVLTFTWPEAFTGDCLSLMLAFNQAMSCSFSEGNALAQQLEDTLGWDYSNGLHLIGHSLGTIVNAAAVNVLPAFEGIHVTILDAPLLLTPINEQDFHQLLRPFPVVEWVDNYIGTSNRFPPAVGDIIEGAAPGGGRLIAQNHPGVHEFYHDTITHTDWVESGFYFSKVLGDKGGYAQRPWPQRWNPPPATRYSSTFLAASIEETSILAGEVLELAAETFGTWRNAFRLTESQRGSARPASGVVLPASQSGAPDAAFSIDLVVPADATVIEFDFVFTKRGDGDWLTARFNDETAFSFRGENFAGSGFQTARIPAVPHAGRIGVFEIALHGAGGVNSEVLVSNLRLLRVPLPKLTAKLKTDATLELTLNGELGWPYDIESSTNLVHWNALTNVTVAQVPPIIVEHVAPDTTAKFYRAVLVP